MPKGHDHLMVSGSDIELITNEHDLKTSGYWRVIDKLFLSISESFVRRLSLLGTTHAQPKMSAQSATSDAWTKRREDSRARGNTKVIAVAVVSSKDSKRTRDTGFS